VSNKKKNIVLPPRTKSDCHDREGEFITRTDISADLNGAIVRDLSPRVCVFFFISRSSRRSCYQRDILCCFSVRKNVSERLALARELFDNLPLLGSRRFNDTFSILMCPLVTSLCFPSFIPSYFFNRNRFHGWQLSLVHSKTFQRDYHLLHVNFQFQSIQFKLCILL